VRTRTFERARAISGGVKQSAMKRLASIALLASALAQPACYGSYSAAHALHRWNGHATGSEVANSVIHFGLYVVPVYELAWVGDFFIFNTVEFFTHKRVFD
jgi:hypothetical protein